MGRKSSNETTKPADRDAAIYVRISLDQGMGELALDRQEKECRDRAARDGVEVSAERVYSDLSISAADARKRRPAYERLLADVCAGEVGRVYVWDLDRLTRQPGQLDQWVKLAKAGLCHVVEAHGMDLDLSRSGDLLVARIRVAVAENESQHKGERQRAANRQRARIGRVPVGNRPTGYTHAGEVIEEEAGAVRAVFAAFLAGASLKAIARALSGERDELTAGVPTLPRPSYRAAVEWNERHPDRPPHELPAEQPWNSSAVLKMLRNPRYAGFATYIPSEVGKNGDKSAPWHNRRVRDEGTGEWVRGQWEPIVPAEDWERVQAVLDDPDRRPKISGKGPAAARTHLGSGLYRCPVCGGRVHLQGVCYTCTGHVARKADLVDAYVASVIEAVLARPDLASLVCVRREGDATEVREIEAEVARQRGRIERAEADYARDLIRAEDLKRARDVAEAAIREAEARLRALADAPEPPAIVREVAPAEAFREADLNAKRAVVDLLCDVYLTKTDRSENARRNARGAGLDPSKAVEFRWKTGAAPAEG